MIKYLTVFLLSCGLTTVRPKLEMKMAAAAFMAAQKVNAAELATNDYRKAEHYYLKASSAYRRKYFNDALRYAQASIKFSERAEYLAKRVALLD